MIPMTRTIDADLFDGWDERQGESRNDNVVLAAGKGGYRPFMTSRSDIEVPVRPHLHYKLRWANNLHKAIFLVVPNSNIFFP